MTEIAIPRRGPAGDAGGGKLLALESLRGFAAITVVLHHFAYGSFLSENAFARHGYLLVDFFFVLSGYVIALTYAGRLRSAADVASFQRKRFWRLYPLHLTMLLVFLCIETAKYWFERETGIVSNAPAFVASDGQAFAANLFLLHGLVLNEVTFNLPSWSISTEFWTYVLFALCFALLPTPARAVPLWIIAAFAGLMALEGGRLETEPIFAIVRCIYSFFLGVGCLLLARRLDVSRLAGLALPLLALSGAAVALLGGTQLEIGIPLLFGAAVLAVAHLPGRSAVRRLLEQPAFVWLGTVSYSVYMTHAAVGWGLTQVLRFVLDAPTTLAPDGDTVFAMSQAAATATVLIGLALVLAVSALTFRYVEQPFRGGWPAKRLRPAAAEPNSARPRA